MSLLRKLRRKLKQNNKVSRPRQMMLEPLEQRLLLSADLQIDSLLVTDPGPFDWGAGVDFDAVVSNADIDDAVGDATVEFYLSDDPTLEIGTDILLAENYTISNLASGASYSNTAASVPSISLPGTPGSDGDKFLFMHLDTTNVTNEADTTNNARELMIQVGSSNPANGIDLQVEEADLPDTIDLIWGNTYDVNADVFNDGNTDTAAAFDVEVVISPDSFYDPGIDQVLYTAEATGGLTAGNSFANDANITLPAAGTQYGGHTYADGSYYIIVIADSTNFTSGGQVAEVFESNNMIAQTVNIVTTPTLSTGVDLMNIEFELDSTSTDLDWGATYAIAADLYNIGDTAAGAFDISVVISSDQNYDAGTDTAVGTINVTSLNSTALSYNETNITLPTSGTLSDGPYYLIMASDSGDVFTEVSETDNISALQVNVSSPRPDLAIENFHFDNPGIIEWSDTVTLDIGIRNIGEIATDGDATVKFFLKDTASFDPATDTPLAQTYTIGSLAVGASDTHQIDVTLPSSGTDGDKYLFVYVDNNSNFTETSTNNNSCPAWIPVGDTTTMTGVIDLTPTEPPEDGASAPPVELLPNIDLIWGNTYNIPLDVYNIGDTAAGAFSVKVLFGQDNPSLSSFIANSTALHTEPLTALPAHGESIQEISITLPASGTDGAYKLMVQADSEDQVTEAFESNNTVSQIVDLVTTPMLATGVDLMNLKFDLDHNPDLAWGESYNIDLDVYNIGDTDASPFGISVVLSSDQNYDAGDYTVGTWEITSLTSTAISYNDFTITLPASGTFSHGNYYLIVKSDSSNVFTEANENDNIMFEQVYVGPPVDLVVGLNDVPEAMELKWAQTYEFAAHVFNDGYSDAAAFDVAVVISLDNVYSATDNVLATVNLSSGLAAFADSDHDVAITLPAAGSSHSGQTYIDGQYYLIAVADSSSTIAESNENNNVSIWPIDIVSTSSLSGTDLGTMGFDLDLGDQAEPAAIPVLAWDQTYTAALALDFFNAGDTAADAFDVTVRFSDDQYYDDTDDLVASLSVTSLDSLAVSINDLDLTTPAGGTDGSGLRNR